MSSLQAACLEVTHDEPRNRRSDPRTDRLFSLRNLLRIRARKFDLPLVALGNHQDMLIAASDEGPRAHAMLLRASKHSGRLRAVGAEAPDHVSHRFRVGEQELVLVAEGRPTGADGNSPGLLEQVFLGSVAERVRSIFSEQNAVRPRGDEAPLLHGSGRLQL